MGRNYCCVLGCKSDTKLNRGLSFFRLPQEKERLLPIIAAIGRQDLLQKNTQTRNYRICSVHFEPRMFKNKRLDSDAIPTLHLPESSKLHFVQEDDTKIEKNNEMFFPPISNDEEMQNDGLNATIVKVESLCTTSSEETSSDEITGNDYQDEGAKLRHSSAIGVEQMYADLQKIWNIDDASCANMSSSNLISTNEIVMTAIQGEKVVVIPEKIIVALPNRNSNTVFVRSTTSDQHPSAKRKLETENNESGEKRSKECATPVEETCHLRSLLEETNNERLSPGEPEDIERFIKQCKVYKNNIKLQYGDTDLYKQNLHHFSLNFYINNPKAYSFLHKFLDLPPVSTLRRTGITYKSGVSEDVCKILSMRMKKLPSNYKYCVLCIDMMPLTQKINYDNVNDDLIGLHEVDGKKTTELANNAFIITLQGCIEEYKLRLGYAFTGPSNDFTEISIWIDKTIEKLFDVGFEVCAVVSSYNDTFEKFATFLGISMNQPFFYVNDKKIYYIFDVYDLLKSLRDNLLECDFVYENKKIVLSSEIMNFYLLDRSRHVKFAPRLTAQHFNKDDRRNLRLATGLFSKTVATGMADNIARGDLRILGSATVDFILIINDIYNLLKPNQISAKNKYRNALSGAKYQKDCLENALKIFESVKVVSKTRKKDVTALHPIFTHFHVSVNSVLQLSDYLFSKGVKYLFTKRLNNSKFKLFSVKIRKDRPPPTAFEFRAAFSKLHHASLLNSVLLRKGDSGDLTATFRESDYVFQSFLAPPMTLLLNPNELRMLGDWSVKVFCAYTFHTCCKKHDGCLLLKKSMRNVSKPGWVMPNDLKMYFDSLEDEFVNTFEEIAVGPDVVTNMLNKLHEVQLYGMPCECFPTDYLLNFYVQGRILLVASESNKIDLKSQDSYYLKLKLPFF